MYQALYRKYRPRRFSDVAGQEHITETLRRQNISGRLSHAYLFVGTRGTGKTTCAKILSRAVNCINPEEGEPCNNCLPCIGIEDGSILDVLELDAASNNSVDNVRALRDEAVYSPATVKKRVYIIDEVHMLSSQAFNALLKILEEPPEHIMFILATTELHKVPATIQGRCQKFSFKRLTVPVLFDRLNLIAAKESITLTEDASGKLALLADGSMRDGISLLDQCVSGDIINMASIQSTLGLTGQSEISNLVTAIANREILSALNILDELYNDGRDMASLLNEIASTYRDLIIYKLSPDSGLINPGFDITVFPNLDSAQSSERLFFCLETVNNSISGLTRGGISKSAVEICIIKMCDERLTDDNTALLSRISNLEMNNTSFTGSDISSSTYKPVETISEKKLEVNLEPNPEPNPETPAQKEIELDYTTHTDPEPNPETPVSAEPDRNTPGKAAADIFDLIKTEPSLNALLGESSKLYTENDDNLIIINVTDTVTADMITASFSETIKEAIIKILGRDVPFNIEISIDDSKKNKEDKKESLLQFINNN